MTVEALPDEDELLDDVDDTDDDDFDDDDLDDIELSPSQVDFIERLIDRIISFQKEMCQVTLFPYQLEVVRGICRSVIRGDGATLTILQSRQSGKTEEVADTLAVLMVLLPRLAKAFPEILGKFKDGFMVGTFAPVESQAETLYSRIVSRLTSDHAVEIMLDPEIDDHPEGGGKLVKLKRSGSFCRMQTANPKAKIESKSYHIIVIDECQDADEYTVNKSIVPMGAFYNGTVVMLGTPSMNKSVFYKTIQLNKRIASRKGKSQHYEFDWKAVAKYNKDYSRFVRREMRRLGEDSDEFQLSYACVAPHTRILTADLRYVPAGDLVVGDRLIGFDEDRAEKGRHRQFRGSVVTRTARITKPGYRVALSDGTVVECSADHQWLVSTPGRRTVWKSTESLTLTDRIFKVADVWSAPTADYETGYLAAAFDGEGHCVNTRSGQIQLGFSQLENAMLDKVRKFLSEKGYAAWEYVNEDTGVKRLAISGGRAAALRFLGEIRPQRLLDGFDPALMGSIGRHDHRGQNFEHPLVVEKTFLGDIEVIPLETSTKTYVAEGLASHNCKWLLERGMFISEQAFEELCDSSMQLVRQWWKSPVLVGVDPARRKDSTVVTVLWVDWDYPDEFGLYECRVLNWLELQGDNWEAQYTEILNFLAPYHVAAIGVDGTGVGDVVADRLSVLFPYSEVHLLDSDQMHQSKRWKHLMQLVQRQMIGWPGHSKAKRLKVWKRFNQQMIDLEKNHHGQYLLAEAPKEAEAHDDYPDSLALACYLTSPDMGIVLPEVEVSESPFVARRR